MTAEPNESQQPMAQRPRRMGRDTKVAVICGFGVASYELAFDAIVPLLEKRAAKAA